MTFDDYLEGIKRSNFQQIIDAHQSPTLPLLLNIITRTMELFPTDEQLAVTALVTGMIHGTLEGTGETPLNAIVGGDPTQGDRLRIWTAMYSVAFQGTVQEKLHPEYPHPKRDSAKVLSLVRPHDPIPPLQDVQDDQEPEAGPYHPPADVEG